MNEYRISAVVTCRVPQSLKQQVLEFRKKYHLKTETEAIIQLLQVALFVDNVREQLRDPEIVRYLSDNLYNERLVDWIFELPNDRLEALFGAFKSAKDLRFQRKMKL
jgi:hypothetical protein